MAGYARCNGRRGLPYRSDIRGRRFRASPHLVAPEAAWPEPDACTAQHGRSLRTAEQQARSHTATVRTSYRIRRLTSHPKVQGRQTGIQAKPERRSIRDPGEPGPSVRMDCRKPCHGQDWAVVHVGSHDLHDIYNLTAPASVQALRKGTLNGAIIAVSGDKPRTIRHGLHPDIAVGVSCNLLYRMLRAQGTSVDRARRSVRSTSYNLDHSYWRADVVGIDLIAVRGRENEEEILYVL
jgi:hypothetical protein